MKPGNITKNVFSYLLIGGEECLTLFSQCFPQQKSPMSIKTNSYIKHEYHIIPVYTTSCSCENKKLNKSQLAQGVVWTLLRRQNTYRQRCFDVVCRLGCDFIISYIPTGKKNKNTHCGSVFLFNQHSKYDADFAGIVLIF